MRYRQCALFIITCQARRRAYDAYRELRMKQRPTTPLPGVASPAIISISPQPSAPIPRGVAAAVCTALVEQHTNIRNYTQHHMPPWPKDCASFSRSSVTSPGEQKTTTIEDTTLASGTLFPGIVVWAAAWGNLCAPPRFCRRSRPARPRVSTSRADTCSTKAFHWSGPTVPWGLSKPPCPLPFGDLCLEPAGSVIEHNHQAYDLHLEAPAQLDRAPGRGRGVGLVVATSLICCDTRHRSSGYSTGRRSL
jgi:hypothetical protein